ncbi:ABC transporter ATPase [Tenacibaculum amylolyticum]|uniref:ABC transporter ATPase n=1 Tax=Tenacibaculum amylolyticum TaxID=104269 RepID=UPI003893ECD9
MLVDFKTLEDEARVWIYPCNRKFYPQELEPLKEKLKSFIEKWKEGEGCKCSFQLLYDRFIVFGANEEAVITNQDLDKQVAFILELQVAYEVELLDKMNVCFKQGEYTQYKTVKEFKKLIKNKSVNSKTIVFDNLVQTKFDLENYWEVPITESWYNRFL